MLQARSNWLKKHGIPYVFVVAPDKQSIYPEMLPEPQRLRVREPSRLDQLLECLRRDTNVHVVDLRQPLRLAKVSETVFYVTDSHWNDLGGHAAYLAVMRAVGTYFPELSSLPRESFFHANVKLPGGDLARMLGLPNLFAEEQTVLVPLEPRLARPVNPGLQTPHLPPQMQPTLFVRADRDLPRVVFFHDSFAKCIKPFLGEHFHRMFCYWAEPYEFDAAIIERERPDIVIQQIVERKLAMPFPPTSLVGFHDQFPDIVGYTARTSAFSTQKNTTTE
jgi:hypothetical protein